MSKSAPKYSIIIPAFNETHIIGQVIEDVKRVFSKENYEIFVIDDGSEDDTAKAATQHGVKVIKHLRNKGYGASLKSGVQAAHGEYVLFMDADGQHRGQDAHKLLEYARSYDMVIAQRIQLMHSPLWRMPGKWLLKLMANYLTRQHIPDLNSGLRIIKRDIVMRFMHLCPQGFSFSTTITLILFNRGYDIKYVPFEIKKRVGKSTVSLATGFDTLLLIIRIATLIEPLRIFVPFSLITGLIGLAWGIPYALAGHGVSTGSMLAIVTAVLLFSIGLISDQISQMRLENL
ncbi:MAG TPA: glycosyltransferase family 2 protein [Anaerolineae bacterium]|nr:glycosyltransferase family 2 protein [Anaerolineae bacterium]